MDWDDAYANGAYIEGADQYPDKWAEAAAEFRSVEQAVGRAMLNLRYGDGARQVYDLFLPAGQAAGLMVFIHGGYWLKFDKSSWSHLAAGATARGWAVAIPSYTLAPEARISEMTQEIARAVEAAAARVPGPIVVTGHSAGGHLSARMGCEDIALAVRERLQKIVPISPLADLRPLMKTKMNDDLKIDANEAKTESPIHHPSPKTPVHVWVGGDERPAFLDQAGWLKDAWGCDLTVDAAKHHFNVIDALAEPESTLVQTLLG